MSLIIESNKIEISKNNVLVFSTDRKMPAVFDEISGSVYLPQVGTSNNTISLAALNYAPDFMLVMGKIIFDAGNSGTIIPPWSFNSNGSILVGGTMYGSNYTNNVSTQGFKYGRILTIFEDGGSLLLHQDSKVSSPNTYPGLTVEYKALLGRYK